MNFFFSEIYRVPVHFLPDRLPTYPRELVDPALIFKNMPAGVTCSAICSGVLSTQVNEFWPQLAEKAYAK